MPSTWITAAEAAEQCGLSVRYVKRLGSTGSLRRKRSENGHKPYLYHADDVATWAEHHSAPAGYVTLSEAAERLSLSPGAIRARCQDGRADCIKRGGRWVVPLADLVAEPTEAQLEAQKLLDSASDLSERERTILSLRALGWSLQAIGDHIGLSRQRVTVIIQKLARKISIFY